MKILDIFCWMKRRVEQGLTIILSVILLILIFACGFYLGQRARDSTPWNDMRSFFALLRYRVGTNAFNLPKNRILLVQYRNKYGAIQLFRSYENSAEFRWWYQIKPADDFSANNISSGTSVVSEKRIITKYSQGYPVEYYGNDRFIRFDDIQIEWSQSDWIYFSNKYGLNLSSYEDISKVRKLKRHRWTYLRTPILSGNVDN